MKQVAISEIDQLTRGEHGQPHAVLGPHPEGDGVTFRVFKPLARTVTVVTADGTRVPLEHEHEGVWVGAMTSAKADVPDYRVEDCVGLDEYPDNSQLIRAVLAASWQFRIRPPRVNGVLQVGDWVRIRVTYEEVPAPAYGDSATR